MRGRSGLQKRQTRATHGHQLGRAQLGPSATMNDLSIFKDGHRDEQVFVKTNLSTDASAASLERAQLSRSGTLPSAGARAKPVCLIKFDRRLDDQLVSDITKAKLIAKTCAEQVHTIHNKPIFDEESLVQFPNDISKF